MDIGYTGAFLGGLLALLSPCSVMLLPAFFAYAFGSPRALVGRTAVFYAGLAGTLVPLGLFAGSVGALLTTHRATVVAVAATVIIVMGLWQISGLPMPGLRRRESAGEDRTSALSVLALGGAYAVAGACTGPILGSVLMLAALGGNPVYGGMVLALYAAGMTVPLLVLALVWKRLGVAGRSWLRPREIGIGRWRTTWTMLVSGLLSIGIGALLLLTEGTASLGGMVSISTQYRAESALSEWASGVSDVWFLLAAVLVLGAWLAWHLARGRRTPAALKPVDIHLDKEAP